MDLKPLDVELPRAVSDALDHGAIVVTGNQRAARTLRRAFDRRNKLASLKLWQPAEVLAWDSWTADLWHRLLLDGNADELLLSRTQEHAIWCSIIANDSENRSHLRSVDSLAELAADAWHLLAQYNGLSRLRNASASFETQTFQRWSTEFEKRCRSRRWLSAAQLEGRLQAAVLAESLQVSKALALVGFDALSPARRNLLDVIRGAGVRVEEINTTIANQDPLLVCATDEPEEVAAAARWARRQLQISPDKRIAIVVPGLEAIRPGIDRTFREILAPDLQGIDSPNHCAPYEFSVGAGLSETPLVRTALDILRWVSTALPLERVSSLLVSPLIAYVEAEVNARASFDAFDLRRSSLLRPEFTLGSVVGMIEQSGRRSHLVHLRGALRSIERTAHKQAVDTGVKRYTEWADAMRDVLAAAQWGSTIEDTIEFQTRKRWESALDELAALDFEGLSVGYSKALGALERIAKSSTFSPESRDAPVQVVGPLEAAGSNFDALWFMRLGDLTWPSRPAVNPLLPWSLQLQLSMPGADPAIDDAYAHRIAKRLAGSATSAIFSYAGETEAGKQRPAPIIESLESRMISIEEIAPHDPKAATLKLEKFSDSASPPSLPDRKIRGGAEILRLQAACGFRAFAERRLWSSDLRTRELGMDATERGNIVHLALEYLWNEVKTQAALKQMGVEDRRAVLQRSIEHGLQRAVDSAVAGWDEAYIEIQRRRLWNLLTPWLDVELNREAFSVKLREKNFDDVAIGPLRLGVRVDRIDATEAGEVLIDYKTGPAKPTDWQSERPDAPQLPLYAVLSDVVQPDVQLAEVAFARIRAGRDMALDGYASKVTATEKRSSRRQTSMAEQVVEWRAILTGLAEAFVRGDAIVDPKSYPQTCTYCGQRTLCRLDPASFDEDIDEETTFDGNG
ncbi:MAG: PD-(D/E)XK nuclease family protein [Acidobacteria bacterium]|nr:PD-(D/E)XK nuclease family protein [Acidobacteriota bacterium]